MQKVASGVTAGVGAGVGAGVSAVTAGVSAVTGSVGAVTGVGKVGEYLKEQRLAAKLSLRQLAELAGVSNPYLSQIERGLRKPSAEVLQQLAKALRISAEQLYVQAGLIAPETRSGVSVEAAILADTRLTVAQRQSLLEIHASFVAVHASSRPAAAQAPEPDEQP
ncbi:helix-turn-helix domain-containing protein [Nocardioides yefusunii]|uniref:Helix-turn-helix domain-containing protein n=1 Tax=Nocardioides yefusunii TaxID=2500546 RepID=A0ABW1QW99_9ACTN|nr:helix-turn-helix transcriptional regulator [Nocardioides yefusunii]